ncbi:hypothetical protein LMF32_03690 [Desemzia sp. C1]|uniref:hypothetical protein n=1 Tax=Desemzia sp. C1 TaxID=2892016 RepID=UPI001E64276A|nr:hypothetical protein [Desemzia sp. C1]MCI3028208.1 hypothetical protein [Desemzia sp. C1]
MKEWHIITSNQTDTLLVDKITSLKGNLENWENIIETLSIYFSNKSSKIEVKENQTLLPKQDYQFYLLSFSQQIVSKDFEKVITQIQTEFFGLLQLSPFYKQLVDSWEELAEEVQLISNDLTFSPLPFSLQSFSNDIVKKSLSLDSAKQANLSALDQLLVKLKVMERVTKRTIFCLIYPENQLTITELQQLDDYLQLTSSSSQYFILSNYHFNAAQNILYKNRIINIHSCVLQKDKLQDILPIHWEDRLFSQACNWYINLVDNIQEKTVVLSLQTVDNLEQFIYVYSLFLLTDTPVIVDLTGVPTSFINYFDTLLADKV